MVFVGIKVYRYTRHSIAQTKFKIRRTLEKCIIGNCNGRNNPEITEKHCVTKDYVLISTYRNVFNILLHSVH